MNSTWEFIESGLVAGKRLMVLYVCDSSGSSPGRKGFTMAVDDTGLFHGTIGGGIMEVKLIELAKHLLRQRANTGRIKPQFHDKQHSTNQSGMICSGEQIVVLLPLHTTDLELIRTISSREEALLVRFSPSGMTIAPRGALEKVQWQSETDFECVASIAPQPRIHIFGAGHVGVALSRQMGLLGYRVLLYDDRPGLPTLRQVNGAWKTILLADYEQLSTALDFRDNDLGVIVSFSYRTDKVLLRLLCDLPFAYLGMMGSGAKIDQLRTDLASAGIAQERFSHIFTPIGLEIYSKTAAEIAVSIAAQIILHRNQHLPTGRKK